MNTTKRLNFSSKHITVTALSDAKDYVFGDEPVIAINPLPETVRLDEPHTDTIPPFSSATLKNTKIDHAKILILLTVHDEKNPGGIALETGWDLLGVILNAPADAADDGENFPRNTPLWRSSQDEVAAVEFDPRIMTGAKPTDQRPERFKIITNLWFAPARTHCFIHNQHDFIELHTQVTGHGRMQKFKTRDHAALYCEEMMTPGYTTSTPYCTIRGRGDYVYPWHQYYSDTDCLWLAIEYHPF